MGLTSSGERLGAELDETQHQGLMRVRPKPVPHEAGRGGLDAAAGVVLPNAQRLPLPARRFSWLGGKSRIRQDEGAPAAKFARFVTYPAEVVVHALVQ